MSSRRRSARHSNSLIGLIKSDQYGVIWLGLIFLLVLVAKWVFVQPLTLEGPGCVMCVLLLIWLVTMVIALINPFLWFYWTEKGEKDISLVFAMSASAIVTAFLATIICRKLLQKLYYSGLLNWPEKQLSFLLDDMVGHVTGLFIGTAVIYGMIRLIMCQDLQDKKLVIPVSLGIALTSVGLLFLGIKIY